MKKTSKIWHFLLCFVLLCLLSGCGRKESEEGINYNSEECTIAVCLDESDEQAAKDAFPNANIIYVPSAADGIEAVLSDRADGFVYQRYAFEAMINSGLTGVKTIDNLNGSSESFVIGITDGTKISSPVQKANDFLREMSDQGILTDMERRWVIEHDYDMPDIPEAEDPDFTLHVGTTALSEPSTFYRNNEVTGYDIELAKRLALYLNAELDITLYDWDGLFSAAETGKEDYLISAIYESSARNGMRISRAYFTDPRMLLVKSGAQDRSISERFYRNFLEEDRWKTLLSGLISTVEITVLATIIGGIIGFLLCILALWGPDFLGKLFGLMKNVILGLPILILLMYFYYIIFYNASGMVVAVGAFSLYFSMQSYQIIKSGIEVIDKGQWEAARVLGFSRNKIFTQIILPQATRHILSPFCQAVSGMMLLTSLCGYVSIIDLTYSAQMIRARTYDALFPLTAVALIYLLLSLSFGYLLRYHSNRLLKKKNRIQKLRESQQPLSNSFIVRNNTKEEILRAEQLRKDYPDLTPIHDLTCSVNQGDIISIIGSSGCGKSTFLRLLAGLEQPTRGEILLHGNVGMVFQSFHLFPHLTAAENVMFAPMQLKGLSRQEAFDRAMKLLRKVGLAEKAFHYPEELSGGQKQRVAIARALAMEPDILLMDEPTSALDPAMAREVEAVIRELAKAGMTMLLVTHDLMLAKEISTRTFYLDEGHIYEEGVTKELFANPQKTKTRLFLKKQDTMVFHIMSRDFDYYSMLSDLTSAGYRYHLSARMLNHLQSVFEEMLLQILFPELPDPIKIIVETRFSENKIHMIYSYNGPSFNPEESENELSLVLLKKMARIDGYEALKDHWLTNRIHIVIEN